MKKNLETILKWLARGVLWLYQPKVVAITGSVGKTTGREATAVVLSTRYRVRSSIKSYNNELGVPLTILGQVSPGHSILGWCKLIARAIWLIMKRDRNYPEVLVLEMGADKPGDIEYLTSIAKPNVAVLTAIAPAHLLEFKNLAAVATEKRSLFKNLQNSDVAILNADDDLVAATKIRPGIRKIYYGITNEAEVRGSELTCRLVSVADHVSGTSFKLTIGGNSIPVFLPGIIGMPAVSAALAAMTVGLVLEVNILEAAKSLSGWQPTPGRLRLLAGINQTILIDDTYNSSPRAVVAALGLLNEVAEERRRIAVLGDMLELGDQTERLHIEVGQTIRSKSLDMLVVIGEQARLLARAARESGLQPDKIFSFMSANEAVSFLKDQIKPQDIILIKGSQGMRLEKVVAGLLVDPGASKKLLVRQDDVWLKT